MVRRVVLHAVPYVRKSLRLENIQGNLQSEMPGSVSTVKHGERSVMIWAAMLILLLPLMAELQQGSTWTGCVIR
jgi:hypothetical protein